MFNKVTMIDYSAPLRMRARRRKVCGPYYWTPAKPGGGRGFYQSQHGMAMDERGSAFRLRIECANDHVPAYYDVASINGYYCDEYGGDTLKPIIARLPGGRGFLGGWTMGKSMCANIDLEVFDTAEDAAIFAHSMAENDAEAELERQAAEDDAA
jgi:hypothetical protein